MLWWPASVPVNRGDKILVDGAVRIRGGPKKTWIWTFKKEMEFGSTQRGDDPQWN